MKKIFRASLKMVLASGFFFTICSGASHAATLVVNSAADTAANDGVCTFREAITAANTNAVSGAATGECAAGAGSDTINFAITPLNGSVKTLTPSTPYPIITQPVVIDASTQNGASCNPRNLKIEVNAVNLSTTALSITANNTNLKGIAVYGLPDSAGAYAVAYFGSTGGLVTCNNFGSKADGTDAYPSGTANGALVVEGSTNMQIGGTTASDRNIFSNNRGQVSLGIITNFDTSNPSENNTVIGNYFGTDPTGMISMPNGSNDISVVSGASNRIGGSAPGESNLFAANSGSMFGTILLSSDDATTANSVTRIQGNSFGLSASGTAASGFGNTTGILLGNAPGTAGVQEAIIGGASAGEGNVFRTSQTAIINLNLGGAYNTGTAIIGNTIYGASFGIDSCEDSDFDFVCDVELGPTANDIGDADLGPNNYINTPVITRINQVGNQLTFTYNLDAIDSPSDTYRIDFFAADTADTYGYGQAQRSFGSDTADLSSGAVTGRTVTFTLPDTNDVTSKVFSATTTAIDVGAAYGFGSTSEFGAVENNAVISYALTEATNGVVQPGTSLSLASTGDNAMLLIATAIIVSSAGTVGFALYSKRQSTF